MREASSRSRRAASGIVSAAYREGRSPEQVAAKVGNNVALFQTLTLNILNLISNLYPGPN
jgi:hypothetical protein